MKLRFLAKFTSIFFILAASSICSFPEPALTEVVKIAPHFQPDPLILTGQSGGQNSSNCGNISKLPNQVLQLTESMSYLKLRVEGSGQPTLLIDGPGGRFCVLAESGGKPEMSGFWTKGVYSIYVGELSAGNHTYILSISEQKNSTP
jgi:hypothetical protein